jgi:hypothetical protein
MPATAVTTINTVIAGVTLTSTITRNEEAAERISLDMPVGIAGTLTTRTDADTGIATVASGHGITTSDTVCVFFADGSKQNCDVTAVTSTTISFTSADGTDLPVVSTVIVIGKQFTYAAAFVGNALRTFAIKCANRCFVDFLSSSPASLLAYDIATNEGRSWVFGTDVTNPLAGDTVASIVVANGGTTVASVEIGLLKSGD